MTASALAPNIPNVLQTVSELQSYDGLLIPNNTIVQLVTSILGGGGLTGSPRTFRYLLGNAAADATAQLVIPPATNAAAGKWILVDQFVNIQLAGITFAQADGSTIFTLPAGFRLQLIRPFLEVGTPFTGGAASTIGLSSSNAAYNTKGDLMGGAAGDAAAVLTAGFKGSAGTKIVAQYNTQPPVVLNAGDTIRWDRIVSAFTAGTATVNLLAHQIF